jgi:hypothetical protein
MITLIGRVAWKKKSGGATTSPIRDCSFWGLASGAFGGLVSGAFGEDASGAASGGPASLGPGSSVAGSAA